MALNGRRLTFAAFLVAGLWVPSARAACVNCHESQLHYRSIGSCVSCHGGMEKTDRKAIAHTGLLAGRFSHHLIPASDHVKRGNEIIEAFSCRRCHLIAGKGNRLAANLDDAPLRESAQLLLNSIRAPSLFMPDFEFTESQLTDVMNSILAAAKNRTLRDTANQETPQVIHFEESVPENSSAFEKHCGGCHRVLSASAGALGRSNTGPNLSGLFSPHYPKTFEGRKTWTADSLKKWLRNPRALNKTTRMPPVEKAAYSDAVIWAKLTDELSAKH
ncbi:MAG: hypothetical protein A2X94_02800 [Bdellovibrionales bacterium GWB1_55_8]|nr:MAG: hypothetical protein A2X94_02800 [Bdellovibrionales bacterium GWB1_55_8]